MDLERKEEFVGSPHQEERAMQFSQLSSLQDHSLSQLRDHIKQVMIPMLIKTFQYQLDVLPGEREMRKIPFQDTVEQLRQLDRDLHNLEQWVQNCRSQMKKALDVASCEGVTSKGLESTKRLEDRLSPQTSSVSSWWRGFFLKKERDYTEGD